MVNGIGVDCFECVLEVADTTVAGEYGGVEILPIVQEEGIELCPNLKRVTERCQ
jgi:hypothetical protein